MTLDPSVRRFLDLIALGGAGRRGVAERREGQRVLARLGGRAPVPAAIREFSLALPAGARAARLYAPPGAQGAGEAGAPGLVFFHGGGLVAGDLDTHDAICRRLAVSADCRVVAVDYRLAPEHPFPAAIEDAVAAVARVAESAAALGIDPARLAVGGESAGAGLAARVCQESRGGPAIAAQLLICPVLDLGRRGASHRAFAEGYLLDARTVEADIAACGVGGRLDEPRVSPLNEPDLAGLPPAHVHTAAFDMVRDDGAAYAGRLAAAGVPVDYTCHAGMIHFFYGLGPLVPRSQPILSEIGARFGDLLRGAAAGASDDLSPSQQRRAS